MTLSHCDRKVNYTFLEGNSVKHIYLLGKKNSTFKNLSNQNNAAYWRAGGGGGTWKYPSTGE